MKSQFELRGGAYIEKDGIFYPNITPPEPDPERLVKEFWDLVNNPNKASVNILSSKDVTIEQIASGR